MNSLHRTNWSSCSLWF